VDGLPAHRLPRAAPAGLEAGERDGGDPRREWQADFPAVNHIGAAGERAPAALRL